MSVHITSGDLDEWSRRRDSEGHLPTLVRRLIMETVRPGWIRMPAAEGVSLSGLDGIMSVSRSTHPYVPEGDSVWEIGTEQGQRGKAVDDYTKRTKQTDVEVRRQTTYVAVTNRKWSKGDKWVEDMKALGDEWRDVIVLTADELTTWLEDCPNAEGWLREHLGKGSLGDTTLNSWFTRWSKQTLPATPDAVLTAGRRKDVIGLLNALDAPTTEAITIAASSVDEAVAFAAAALRLGPQPLPRDTTTSQTDEEPKPDPDLRTPEHLEALRERTIVITDEMGWRRWRNHHTPHILIPLFMPDSISEAVEAGHHVILPKTARTAHEDGRLQPIDPHGASSAWKDVGIDFSKAHEYALATRRNLGSLRRRISRHGHQTPAWASGLNAPLLASAALAGEWDATHEGDREVLLALTRAADWPDLAKTITQLAAGEDPPLGVLGNHWDFVDIVDAWDAISNLTTPDDIRTFTEVLKDALTETDPEGDLTFQERFLLDLNDDRPKRRHSNALKRGLSTTLAMLGAHTGDQAVGGSRTGQELATQMVRDLLENADETRWLTLPSQLQLLAEAAPDAFLHALETSLRSEEPPVMALFLEDNDSLSTNSAHSALLWALETLAFSPTYVARVAIILARLAALDPGGKLANRPSATLVSLLDLIRPDGAISASNRLDVLDAVTAAVPEHATSLLQSLVESRGGGIVPSGPRYRDWPTDRYQTTNAEYQTALTGICTRLLELSGNQGLTTAAGLVSRFSSADLIRVLDALAARWGDLEEAHQVEVLNKLADDADHHRRYSDTGWAMQPGDLDAINKFLEDHGFDFTAGQDEGMFSWESDLDEHRQRDDASETPRETVTERRAGVIKSVLNAGGLDAVMELAAKVEVPGYVGIALAHHDADTNEYTDEVLDLLGDGEAQSGAANVAWGYATRRAEDFTWLTDQVSKRPTQGAVLLRTVRTSAAVLSLLAKLEDDQQALFWKGMNPYRLNSEVVEQVCKGLLSVGRPFSAVTAAAVRDEPWPTAELIIAVLRADLEDSNEPAPTDHHQLSYTVGILLNRLEKLGTDDETLANLEFYYLPVLEHDRKPRALHRELARKPELFVTAITSVYKPDHEPDTDVAAAVSGTETSGMTAQEFRFSSAAWSLLHGWDGPLPGTTTTGTTPTTEEVQAWVDRVRTLLTEANRSQIVSTVIGEALAAPVVDDDGIWPCEAVRNVIENEQSDDLETGLCIKRLNQRGVHGRSIYAGGQQERDLAAKYGEHANKVRNRWPRTGAMLETLARSYNADARREDDSAEHDARRHS